MERTQDYRPIKQRLRFFEALGIEDDGRKHPIMTKDEFYAFCSGRIRTNEKCLHRGKALIYTTVEPYCEVSYYYCPVDGKIHEARFNYD